MLLSFQRRPFKILWKQFWCCSWAVRIWMSTLARRKSSPHPVDQNLDMYHLNYEGCVWVWENLLHCLPPESAFYIIFAITLQSTTCTVTQVLYKYNAIHNCNEHFQYWIGRNCTFQIHDHSIDSIWQWRCLDHHRVCLISIAGATLSVVLIICLVVFIS